MGKHYIQQYYSYITVKTSVICVVVWQTFSKAPTFLEMTKSPTCKWLTYCSIE
jgi:hypothetical protein